MKNRKTRLSLLICLFVLTFSLAALLIVSAGAETDAQDAVTVEYPNGVSETYAEGDVILPIEVPKDFARYDAAGDAYVYTVTEGAEWSFTLNGKALSDLTVTSAMLGKKITADIAGTMGTEKVFYTIKENIKDKTVPEEKRGEFFIYGYDEASLILYLSRNNDGGDPTNPRYRYLRQRDNVFHITMYTDLYPTKFDPRWGAASKDWELTYEGVTYMVQDRTWRGDAFSNGAPAPAGTSARVYFNLNGHTLEIGSSEAFHFGSMACTPYSMRLFFYSTRPGAVFSGAKSEAVFYSDDDSTVYVGELASGETKYGQNLSVYGKMIAHVNYGGGVWLWGGRYYQVATNHAFINISHRLYEAKNCEFYLADQSEAVLFFNDGQKYSWKTNYSPLQFENCTFYVAQHGTKLLREVATRNNNGVETPSVPILVPYSLKFVDCEFYGIPTMLGGDYLACNYEGNTKYSVGMPDNLGSDSSPKYISYLAEPRSERTLTARDGSPIKVYESCAILPSNEVSCVQYLSNRTYWQPGATPFVYDNVVMNEIERYVETGGKYIGLPATLVAGQTYFATGINYEKRVYVAFIYVQKNGVEGYGLAGDTQEETGKNFAARLGNISDVTITLLSDIVLSGNVDFGTKGYINLDMNGYSIKVARTATPMGAVHRIGDSLNFRIYSSREGAVYENLSEHPIFSLAHDGKAGTINLGDYEYVLGKVYPGTNVTYISNGSFYRGYAQNAEILNVSEFNAKNCTFVYKGNGIGFLFANNAHLENCKVAIQPTNRTKTPTITATLASASTSVSFGGSSFYAPEGVNVNLYSCVNADGEAVSVADELHRVSFGAVAFYNVSGSLFYPVENLEFNCTNPVFNSLDALSAFYAGNFPVNQALMHSSAEFYIDGALKRYTMWVCADPSRLATVTFDTGKAGLGSVTEEWLVGSVAYCEPFVVDGLFVYSYGQRTVEKGSNRFTAGCKALAPGAMRISLSLTAGTYVNLFVPQDSDIASITLAGMKTDIVSSLDYYGDYYVVRYALTPELIASTLDLTVTTATRTETVTLQLSAYARELIGSETASIEAKQAAYALFSMIEKTVSKDLEILPPLGYQDRTVNTETLDELPAGISAITFDYLGGAILKISGTSGKVIEVTFVSDGSKTTRTITDGVCTFEDVAAGKLCDGFSIKIDGEVFNYSAAYYKGSSKDAAVHADSLYNYFYYANRLLIKAAD